MSFDFNKKDIKESCDYPKERIRNHSSIQNTEEEKTPESESGDFKEYPTIVLENESYMNNLDEDYA
jgi:hypothetical protein